METAARATDKSSPGRSLLPFLLILLAAFAVYGRVYGHLFLTEWDDPEYLVGNALAHGLTWDHVRGAFGRFFVGNYAPLHIVSYMVDYSLWGLRPAGYLLENVFLHGLNGCLLYLLVRRLHGRTAVATVAALLFVVHPAQVEAVAWVSQRKSVLSLLFFLASLIGYVAYRRGGAGPSRCSYWLSVAAFAAALLTKSTAVVLPAILRLFDHCFEGRPLPRSLADKVPYAVAAAGAALLAMVSQSPGYGGGGRVPFHGGSPLATLLTMLPVLVSYLRIIVWPTGLSAAYAPAIKATPDLEVALATLLLSAIAACTVLLYRRERRLFFWLAIAPIGLLPVSQVVPLVTLMNDRYLYYPMVGIAPFVALGGALALERLLPGDRKIGVVLAALLIVALGTTAARRVTVWHDAATLWGDAVAKVPHSFMANYVLGSIRVKSGRPQEALPLLERLGRMDPDNPKVLELWGHYHYQTGDLARAEAAYRAAIARNPGRHKARLYLGNIYLGQGRAAEAMEHFRAAQQAAPLSPDIAYSIACAEAVLRRADDAMASLRRAFALGFTDCGAVGGNPELDPLRTRGEYGAIMAEFCTPRTRRQ